MANYKKKVNFMDTEEGHDFKLKLEELQSDQGYNTEPSYNANSELYPDNLISFVDKHVNYLSAHPSVNPTHYISNLKIITRVRK